jgi:nanoRNase/pAp phosphatase (c-di-AMP/oligoRNAs hydrolase)
MQNPKNLIDLLKPKGVVYIQTHNFPDHDSIASAFGLKHILSQFGIESRIIYDGTMQRGSLISLTQRLSIDAHEASWYDLRESDTIVVVDGCKGNKNVTDLPGNEVAVIDHHEVTSPEDVSYIDIRPKYGACSTIIFRYFQELELPIPAEVATALHAGILTDTHQMTRGVYEEDLEAYATLYTKADVPFVNSNLRNSIQVQERTFFIKALQAMKIRGNCAFFYFEDGCNQNLMGILCDFLLGFAEIDMALLCAKNGTVINFSIRSERPEWSAAAIIERLLKGIGFGGGHAEMAGGIIKDLALFNPDDFYARFSNTIESEYL